MTVLFDVDSGRIARELWRHEALRTAVAAQAVALADASPPQLQTNRDDAAPNPQAAPRGAADTPAPPDDPETPPDDPDDPEAPPEGTDDPEAPPEGTGVGSADLQANLDALESFPIGWELDEKNRPDLPDTFVEWLGKMLGWLVTVAAVSLGAPFWFDLLSKVARLRAAGNPARG